MKWFVVLDNNYPLNLFQSDPEVAKSINPFLLKYHKENLKESSAEAILSKVIQSNSNHEGVAAKTLNTRSKRKKTKT